MSNSVGSHRIYIDESGDHTLGQGIGEGIDKSSPDYKRHIARRYLGLTAILVNRDYYKNVLWAALNRIKETVFNRDPDSPIYFHRKDILQCKGPFYVLRNDEERRNQFDEAILKIFRECEYILITVVIDKTKHLNKYQEAAMHPYHYCFQVMLERCCYFLNTYNKRADILIETRGKKENALLQSIYSQIRQNGTYYHGANYFAQTLFSDALIFKEKRDNIAGLQVADMLALPSKEDVLYEFKIERGIMSDFTKKVCKSIQSKYLRKSMESRVRGYGKVFL